MGVEIIRKQIVCVCWGGRSKCKTRAEVEKRRMKGPCLGSIKRREHFLEGEEEETRLLYYFYIL